MSKKGYWSVEVNDKGKTVGKTWVKEPKKTKEKHVNSPEKEVTLVEAIQASSKQNVSERTAAKEGYLKKQWRKNKASETRSEDTLLFAVTSPLWIPVYSGLKSAKALKDLADAGINKVTGDETRCEKKLAEAKKHGLKAAKPLVRGVMLPGNIAVGTIDKIQKSAQPKVEYVNDKKDISPKGIEKANAIPKKGIEIC